MPKKEKLDLSKIKKGMPVADVLEAVVAAQEKLLFERLSRGGRLGTPARELAEKQRHVEYRRQRKRQGTYRRVAPRKRYGKLPVLGWQALVARMRPGQWYGMNELRELLPEFSRTTVRGYVYKFCRRHGCIRRVRNVDWDPARGGGQVESMHVYGLTRKGELMGELWRSVLGEQLEYETGDHGAGEHCGDRDQDTDGD